MNEMVQIRSVKQYFNEFIVKNKEDLGDIVKRSRIKMQILDAFRKEVFEQIVFKFGADVLKKPKDEMAGMDGIHNILVNEFRKWRRLCMLANEAGLVNWLCLNDLKQILEDDEQPDGTVSGKTSSETGEEA